MQYIDLHVHSNASDGTLTPTELVEKGVSQGLTALALTDHDTIQGVEEAITAANKASKAGTPIRVIPGVELSVAYHNSDIHILGLLVDYKNTEFCKTLDALKEERECRNDKMAQNLAKSGIPISLAELEREYPNAIITRAHFAKHLIKLNIVKSNQEAFQKYLSEDSPYYVARSYLSPKEGLDLIRLAGGVSILAHPLLYHYSNSELDQLIGLLKEDGLTGIEAIHSTNTRFDEAFIKKYAHKYDLLITGGSDYHGSNKPLIELGVGRGNLRIPYSLLEALEEKKRK